MTPLFSWARATIQTIQKNIRPSKSLPLKPRFSPARATIQKTIQENIRHAARSGDDKKLNQVASRKKKLERLGLEANSKGHRFKLNRDRPGYHNSVRDEIVVERDDPPVTWKFPEPPELRHHGPVVALEGVGFGYERGEARSVHGRLLRLVHSQRGPNLGTFKTSAFLIPHVGCSCSCSFLCRFFMFLAEGFNMEAIESCEGLAALRRQITIGFIQSGPTYLAPLKY